MTLQQADLTGAWRLAAATSTGPDGQVTHPFGTAPEGMLLYTPDGWMSATITSTADGVPPTVYAGRAGVRGDTVVHSVEVGLHPFGPGTEQVRAASLDGDRLVLTARIGHSEPRTVELQWRRTSA